MTVAIAKLIQQPLSFDEFLARYGYEIQQFRGSQTIVSQAFLSLELMAEQVLQAGK